MTFTAQRGRSLDGGGHQLSRDGRSHRHRNMLRENAREMRRPTPHPRVPTFSGNETKYMRSDAPRAPALAKPRMSGDMGVPLKQGATAEERERREGGVDGHEPSGKHTANGERVTPLADPAQRLQPHNAARACRGPHCFWGLAPATMNPPRRPVVFAC